MPVEAQTRDELARRLQRGTAAARRAAAARAGGQEPQGFHTDVAEWAASHGYAEIRADGKLHAASERLRLDRFREHDVEIVIGRPGRTGAERGADATGRAAMPPRS